MSHNQSTINKNVLVWFLIYLDFIWVKVFDIEYVIKIEVRAIFDINFSDPLLWHSLGKMFIHISWEVIYDNKHRIDFYFCVVVMINIWSINFSTRKIFDTNKYSSLSLVYKISSIWFVQKSPILAVLYSWPQFCTL